MSTITHKHSKYMFLVVKSIKVNGNRSRNLWLWLLFIGLSWTLNIIRLFATYYLL